MALAMLEESGRGRFMRVSYANYLSKRQRSVRGAT